MSTVVLPTAEVAARKVIDKLIDECDGEASVADLMLDVSRRDGAGRVHKLTTIGAPPPEFTTAEWIEELFGGQVSYSIRFRIRGVSGHKAESTIELDLRDSPVPLKDPPRGGWKYLGREEPEDLDDDDDDADPVGYGTDPLVRELLAEAREERKLLERRLRIEQNEREKDRRAEAQRQHELTLALIGGRNTAPAAEQTEDPLTALIRKRVMKNAADSILGRGVGSGGDDDDDGLLGRESRSFLDPALQAFGKRFADRVAMDDDDDDQEPDVDENDELVRRAGAARQKREARRAAAARELAAREKKKKAAAARRRKKTSARNGAAKGRSAARTEENEPQVE